MKDAMIKESKPHGGFLRKDRDAIYKSLIMNSDNVILPELFVPAGLVAAAVTLSWRSTGQSGRIPSPSTRGPTWEAILQWLDAHRLCTQDREEATVLVCGTLSRGAYLRHAILRGAYLGRLHIYISTFSGAGHHITCLSLLTEEGTLGLGGEYKHRCEQHLTLKGTA